jgi:hypothetical protein
MGRKRVQIIKLTRFGRMPVTGAVLLQANQSWEMSRPIFGVSVVVHNNSEAPVWLSMPGPRRRTARKAGKIDASKGRR